MFKVVILQESRKRLTVPENWFRTIKNNFGIIFYSSNKNSVPQFENVRKNFHGKEERCYHGHSLKDFSKFCFPHFTEHRKRNINQLCPFIGSEAEAIVYMERKRNLLPVKYMFSAKKTEVPLYNLPLDVTSEDEIFVVEDSDIDEEADLNNTPIEHDAIEHDNRAADTTVLSTSNIAMQTADADAPRAMCPATKSSRARSQYKMLHEMLVGTQALAAPEKIDVGTQTDLAWNIHMVQFKQEAQKTIKRLNDRIGDEKIESESGSDNSSDDEVEEDRFSDTEDDGKQSDGRFARRYRFVTNVSISFMILVRKKYSVFVFFSLMVTDSIWMDVRKYLCKKSEH